jgi:putative membrane-bound dehydrogenase-like protein
MMPMQKLILIAISLGLCSLIQIGCKSGKEEPRKDEGKDKYSGQEFKENIRSTPARTPEDQRLGFKLPEGFEITLYASEPDIGKPINITFDAKGRMWVTQSFEYPFAATPGKGKDRVTILEDTDQDGKADKIVHFNDTLNIPIGIIPVNEGAIAYSIPNVYRYSDANGDGKVDGQKKLFGPFEHRDTHGMVNNFIIGYDGWIHACHGFTNQSAIAGADGDSIHMVSGNTFRFRRDGSRVEHTTYGRINPFGLAYDELGYLYSTDCHTSPLYQLIRGGDYTQWGKEEQMGFAPDMKPLEDEATALAGIAYYADTRYPEDYRKNFYIGDAVASRVYRNSYSFKGSSPVGKKEEDFILSEDPWFRPVDVKLGPDGALYIADFYNSIIGHYEVALDHPKRDRIRGRIWRVTYKGNVNKVDNLTTASLESLLKTLNADNLALRLTAADQIVERVGKSAISPVNALISKNGITTNEYIHSLWILQRLNSLTEDIIKKAVTSNDPVVRLHAMRVLTEQHDSSTTLFPLIKNALTDKDPHVKRAAVELMAKDANLNTIQTLIAERQKTPDFDTHLIYTLRLMLRNLLRIEPLMKEVVSKQWENEDAAVLATVLTGVQTPESGKFLFNYVKNQTLSRDELPKAFLHIARFIPDDQMNEVTITARQQGSKDVDLEYAIFKQLQEGIARRGGKENAQMQDWGKALAVNLINKDANVKVADTDKENAEKITERRRFAMDLAGNYKLSALQPRLLAALQDTSTHIDVRTSALRALLKIDLAKNIHLAKATFENQTTKDDLRRRILAQLGEFTGPQVNKTLAEIRNVPPDLQQLLTTALAASPEGINIIFDKVKKGEIFPRMLIQPKVEERIMMNISKKQRAEYNTLTADLENIDKEKQSLIAGRITDFHDANPAPSPATGRTVFTRNCATCHSVSGEGGSIGPQLDGVGKWGANSLIEKILDPNRNVSESFRNYTIKLKDGKMLSGLYRREEGALVVFADISGKEFTVAKKDIAEQTPSKYTLMPDQFGTTISPGDLNALVAYLLTIKN